MYKILCSFLLCQFVVSCSSESTSDAKRFQFERNNTQISLIIEDRGEAPFVLTDSKMAIFKLLKQHVDTDIDDMLSPNIDTSDVDGRITRTQANLDTVVSDLADPNTTNPVIRRELENRKRNLEAQLVDLQSEREGEIEQQSLEYRARIVQAGFPDTAAKKEAAEYVIAWAEIQSTNSEHTDEQARVAGYIYDYANKTGARKATYRHHVECEFETWDEDEVCDTVDTYADSEQRNSWDVDLNAACQAVSSQATGCWESDLYSRAIAGRRTFTPIVEQARELEDLR